MLNERCKRLWTPPGVQGVGVTFSSIHLCERYLHSTTLSGENTEVSKPYPRSTKMCKIKKANVNRVKYGFHPPNPFLFVRGLYGSVLTPLTNL